MSPSLRSALFGFAIGTLPLAACTFLYFTMEYFNNGFPGDSIAFAIIGIYIVSTVAVFVLSIRWMARAQKTKGSMSLFILLAQAVTAFWFLAL